MATSRKGKYGSDSIYLMFVKCITIVSSMIQTMILSRKLDVYDYGTYSQAILIISISTTIFSIGLDSAVLYFFNRENDINKKKLYINNILTLSIIFGVIGFLLINIFKNEFTVYFNNEDIKNLIIYLSIKPLLNNLILILQSLYISSGEAKFISIRNFVVSSMQLISIIIITNFTLNIATIIISMIAIDIIQIIFLGWNFFREHFKLNICKIKFNLIRDILKYSIPLGVALMMGTLLKDMDKLLIGKFMSTEDLALYTNVSKQLPFEFIVSSLTLVITPKIISLANNNKITDLKNILKSYIKIGYISTWILAGGALSVAPELLQFLYSEKYKAGLWIFVIYILVDMARFTNFGMLLNANGKSKLILRYSILTLAINFVLNIVFLKLMGMIGAAIASLLSIIFVGFIQLYHGTKMLKISLIEILDIKKIKSLILQIIVFTIINIKVKEFLYKFIDSNFIILIIAYLIFILIMVLINGKDIKKLFKELNSIK
ncbi:oligosaccharide flippase family protein [Clostridium sp.]|uniref:oligosaccharide flippase family protein n=1 Tax=Clostridium sp. TaxID=1506 RepID=UPI0025C697E8|nr:oligosaccharide flippase family protein [Clostridium sp.]